MKKINKLILASVIVLGISTPNLNAVAADYSGGYNELMQAITSDGSVDLDRIFTQDQEIIIESPLPEIVGNNAVLTINGNGQNINGENREGFKVLPGQSLNLQGIGSLSPDGTVNTSFNSFKADYGAGVYAQGNINIADSVFLNNEAFNSGGVVYNYFENYTANSLISKLVSGSTFDSNHSSNDAGAIYNFLYNAGEDLNLSWIIENTKFSENYSENSNGGAIYSYIANNAPNSVISTSIIDSKFDSNHSFAFGGALYNSISNNGDASNLSLKIESSDFIENQAINEYGGAIYNNTENYGANSIILDSIADSKFNSNHSQYGGGAIYSSLYNEGEALNASWIIENSEFNGNYSSNGSGGAIYSYISNQVANSIILDSITDSKFNSNHSHADGGVLYNSLYNYGDTSNSSLLIENSEFNENYSANGVGGTIFNNIENYAAYSSISTEITGSTFDSNHALSNGGALYNYSYLYGPTSGLSTKITDSIFKNNYSEEGSGGAISNLADGSGKYNIFNFEITGSTFDSNNSYQNGGAIYNQTSLTGKNSYAPMTIKNSTFTNNHSLEAYGGAIYHSGGTLNIIADGADTVFTGNTDSTGSNAIYIDKGYFNINAGNGGSVIFNDAINANNNYITVNFETDGGAKSPPIGTPYDGVVQINNTVSNADLALYNGTLKLGHDSNLSSTNLTLVGGILSLENNRADDILSVKHFAAYENASIRFDADFSTGENDTIFANIASGTLNTSRLNILADGNISSLTLFQNGIAPDLQSFMVYTNNYGYTFTQGATRGVYDVTINNISFSGLAAAVAENFIYRSFSAVADEDVFGYLEEMACEGSTLDIFGNGYNINGNGNSGIKVLAGQTLNIQEVGSLNPDGSVNTSWNGFAYDNGGGIYTEGNLNITDSVFYNNEAFTVGGTIYNLASFDEANMSNITNITGSTFDSNHALYSGGALYYENYFNSDDGILATKITDSTFKNNYSDQYFGGAIYNRRETGGTNNTASLEITSTIFDSNHSANNGGVLYNENYLFGNSGRIATKITDSTFRNNYSELYGGVIHNNSQVYGTENIASLEITGSTFESNHAVYHGGAFYNESCLNASDGQISTLISDSIFTNNYSEYGNGGAIYSYSAFYSTSEAPQFLITGSTFNSNHAMGSGGAISNDISDSVDTSTLSFRVENSEFGGNYSTNGEGGAINNYIQSSASNSNISTVITDSIFNSNHAANNGGAFFNQNYLYSDSTTLNTRISGSTFDNNYSESCSGGAIYNVGSDSGTNNNMSMTIENSTFTNNHANSGLGGAIFHNGGTLNIIADGSDTVFTGNTDFHGSNAIYVENGNLNINAGNGGSVIFNDAVTFASSGNDVNINYLSEGNAGEAPLGTPVDGTVELNNYLQNQTLNLYNGTLKLGSGEYIDNSDLNLYGGTLNLENNRADDIVSINNFYSDGASIRFDADFRENQNDMIYANSATGTLNVAHLNIMRDGDISAMTLFGNEIAPSLAGFNAFTNSYKYIFTPSGDYLGVFDVTRELIPSSSGLITAVRESSSYRSFSATEDESLDVGAGLMQGVDSTLDIYGNGYNINGSGFGGIITEIGQTLNIESVGSLNQDGSINTSWNGQISENGGVVLTGGNLNVSDSVFYSNEALNDGGVIYNYQQNYNPEVVIANNVTNTTFEANHASSDGGSIYNHVENYEANVIQSFTISDSIFKNNYSENGNGGAIYNYIQDDNWNNNNLSLTIKNATFTNNHADNGFGGAIYQENGWLNIIADGADTVFTGNTDSSGSNAIYINSGRVGINAGNGGSVIFNDGIIGGNQGEGYIVVNQTSYGNQTEAPIGSPTDGSVEINSDISNVSFELYDGTLNFNTGSNYTSGNLYVANGTFNLNSGSNIASSYIYTEDGISNIKSGSNISSTEFEIGNGTVNINQGSVIESSNIYLYGGTLNPETGSDLSTSSLKIYNGTLNLENNRADDILYVNDFFADENASLRFDADLSTGQSDMIYANSANGVLRVGSLNILTEGDISTLTLFGNEIAPELKRFGVFTTNYRYNFEQSATAGVYDVTKMAKLTSGIHFAVEDDESYRSFSATENTNLLYDLGQMNGTNATLDLFGNGHSLNALGYSGISVAAGQTINIDGFGSLNPDGSVNTSINGFYSTRGGFINNLANINVSDSVFANNGSKYEGGVFYKNINSDSADLLTSVLISNSAFLNNHCEQGNGGVLHNYNSIYVQNADNTDLLSNLVITNSAFLSNYSAQGNGGAIYNNNNFNGLLDSEFNEEITNSIFDSNYSYYSGGAIYNYNYTNSENFLINTKISNSQFLNNISIQSDAGAVYNYSQTQGTNDKSIFEIINTTFDSNKSRSGGGALISNLGTYGSTSESNALIINSTFTNNYSEQGAGGAIYSSTNIGGTNNKSTFGIINTTFDSNHSYWQSGALYAYMSANGTDGEVTTLINNSIFSNNYSINSDGGAINSYDYISGTNNRSLLEIANATFDSNKSRGVGGAFYNYMYASGTNGENMTLITDSAYTNNSSEQGTGGAIYSNAYIASTNNKSIFEIKNTTFDSNKVIGSGGAILNYMNATGFDGEINTLISDSTFINNNAEQNHAGAIYNGGTINGTNNKSVFEISNTTFDSNKSKISGGALYNNFYAGGTNGDATTLITNSLFTNNTSQSSNGGAIFNNSQTSGTNNKISTIIKNSTFTNNHANGGLGGAIFSSAGTINLIADAADTTFSGNTDSKGSNAIHINQGTLNINAGNGGEVIFNDSISTAATSNNININKLPTGLANEPSVGSPIDGLVTFNNAVKLATINLYNGSLKLGHSSNLSSSNLNLYGGVLNLQNDRADDVVTINNFSINSSARVRIDADFDSNQNDMFTVSSANGTFNLDDIHVLNDGHITSMRLFTGNIAPTLESFEAFTTDYCYEFTPSATTGVYDVTSTTLAGLNYAIQQPETPRSFSATRDTDADYNLGFLNGAQAQMTIFGNNHNINGIGYSGLSLLSGQTLNIEGVGSLNADGTVKTSWNGFYSGENGAAINNSGTLNIYDSVFSNNESDGNGAAIYNSANLNIEDSTFIANTANHAGGSLYLNMSNAQDDEIITNNIVSSTFVHNESLQSSGGAIATKAENNDVNSIISTNITNSSFTSNNACLNAGAILSDGSEISITNSLFTNNTAHIGLGGAIYADNNSTVNIIANGANTIFTGNTDSTGSNAIHLESATLNLNSGNGGIIKIDDKITSSNTSNFININKIGSDASGNPPASAPTSGLIYLSNSVSDSTLNLYNGGIYLAKDNYLDGNNVNLYGGNINMVNNTIGTMALNNLSLHGNSTLAIDADLVNGTADKILSANPVTSSLPTNKIYIDRINMLNDATQTSTDILIADANAKDYIMLGQTKAQSPIYQYDISYNSTGGNLNFASTGFNPSVLGSLVSTSTGTYLTQVNMYQEALSRTDAMMFMPQSDRLLLKYNNKYASAGNSDQFVFSPTMLPEERAGIWFKQFTTFENVPLNNGPNVSNVVYGMLVGADSEMKELKRGYTGYVTAYAGYTGSHQNYNNIGSYQNGGLVGLTGTVYKGNFFASLTTNVGASNGNSQSSYGTDNFTTIIAGAAGKIGYNFEFLQGKLILQPTYTMSYTFADTFDYTAASGVNMTSSPLNAMQITPGLKIIGNLKDGWQPYLGVNMVWNIMDSTKFYANDVQLPQLSVDPYLEYGVGLQRKWGERFTGFGQAMARGGGRNGIALQFGFRYAVGK